MQLFRGLSSSSKKLLLFGLAALLLVGVPLTVYVAQTEQDIRQEAAGKKNNKNDKDKKEDKKKQNNKKDDKKDNKDNKKDTKPKQDAKKNDKKDNKNDNKGKNSGKGGNNNGGNQPTGTPDEVVDEEEEVIDEETGEPVEEDGPTRVTVAVVSFVAGDANDDGEINILDFNLIRSCLDNLLETTTEIDEETGEPIETTDVIASGTCDEFAREGSDLDDNGTVDDIDISLFIRELSTHRGEETATEGVPPTDETEEPTATPEPTTGA